MFLAQGSVVKMVPLHVGPLLSMNLKFLMVWNLSYCKEMVCAMGGGIKLLVMLCPVLFISYNMKHKIKLKQTSSVRGSKT